MSLTGSMQTLGKSPSLLVFLSYCHFIPVSVAAQRVDGYTNMNLVTFKDLNKEGRPDYIIAPATSPCQYEADPVYKNGTLVDCRGLGLTNVHTDWFPLSTTTIYLDRNSLSRLDNFSFSPNNGLRKLSIRQNVISAISDQTFKGLRSLEFLDLEYNSINLDERALNPFILKDLRNLMHLGIAFNGNKERPGQYPDGLFLGLKKLSTLTLDTFYGTLTFDRLFLDVKNLTSLVLSGGMYKITNESFVSLKESPLKHLMFRSAELNNGTDMNALQYFKDLQTFSIIFSCQRIENTFFSLFPFQNWNIASLLFDRIAQFEQPWSINSNTYIDRYTTQYLRNICVENFSLTNSRVFFLTVDVFTSRLWHRCLKTLDLRGNPLLGNLFLLYSLSPMRSLASFRIHNCKYNDYDGKLPPQTNSMDTSLMGKINEPREGRPRHMDGHHQNFVTKNYNTKLQGETEKKDVAVELNTSFTEFFKNKQSLEETRIYFTPPNLEICQFSGCLHTIPIIHDTIVFQNAGRVKYFDISDNGVVQFYGKIEGLTNVSYVDMSYNNAADMSVSFLDTFSTVRHLRMVGMNLNNSLALIRGARFFHHLTQLEIIDLSANGLSSLESTSFNNCPQLVSINLSRNKFRSIPIYQSLPRRLQKLDMAHNSIVSISEQEGYFLDHHAKRMSNFSIQLAGNLMSCGCSDTKFLLWLKHTKVNLDKERDYPCIDQNGKLLHTEIKMNNIMALWRLCSGPRALYLSIVLMTLMILSYIICFFFIHFQSFIVNGIIGLFTRNFIVKTPADYRFGVFIGYSDVDYRFACFSLRRFVEDVTHLTTYVRHRDLLPSTNMAESIMETMNSSWRVLLLVTDEFLQHEHWAFFTLRAAVYCVDPLNPRRVVLIVENGCMQHIPHSLLRVVPEDSIIQVDKPLVLGPYERQFLANAVKM